jgi:hypothetical protein
MYGPMNIKLVDFNIGGFHIVVLFNLSEEKVHIPSAVTTDSEKSDTVR